MISCIVSMSHFIPLAEEHYSVKNVSKAKFAEYMYLWAKENNCTFHQPNNIVCPEDVFIMFKLKGCVLRELEQMKVIVDEYFDQ